MLQLLDCTLRDGAHVNAGNFGNENIKKLADGLRQAHIDIIELGFLRNVVYDCNKSYYPRIEQAYDMLSCDMPSQGETEGSAEYALMARADEYDVTKLSECDGRIKYIRIAFYYDYLDAAMKFAREVMARGYLVAFNVINTPGCSKTDLFRVIEYANRLLPRIVTVVDTFGVLTLEELLPVCGEYMSHLDARITVGLHVHENLSLAFSLAKGFIAYGRDRRDIIVDASLMGMGRIPGNLCTELIADYMNVHEGKRYDMQKLLALIENIIQPVRRETEWGYSPAYFLSAKHRVHRSYAEYLAKNQFPLEVMDILLSSIDRAHAGKFDRDYMDLLVKRGKYESVCHG